MGKDFKEGFSKGLGLTTGVLAIPVAGLLLFGAYRVLKVPIRDFAFKFLRSEEIFKYYECVEKSIERSDEQTEAYKKIYVEGLDVEVPPDVERCERPTREWKWQPKDN